MEAYAWDQLIASAEAVRPGLGDLVGLLTSLVEAGVLLAGDRSGLDGDGVVVGSFDRVEGLVVSDGRELQRRVLQFVLDAQALVEVRREGVVDAAGVARTWVERGHGRTVTGVLGSVVLTRLAYRGVGVGNLYVRDREWSVPVRRYSYALQFKALGYALAGSYRRAGQWVAAETGVVVGTRQLEQVVVEATRDAEAFYRRERACPVVVGAVLVMSVDGKGVPMRPEARRTRAAPTVFDHRPGIGEKRGVKRMCEVAVVYDAIPPDTVRTPEAIMGSAADSRPAGPVARNRWYRTDITADRAVTISAAFDQAQARDPAHERDWVVLVDGDLTQIALIEQQAAERQVTVTILIDLIHVLEYLWRLAWCFHPPQDKNAEAWVTARATEILHGRTDQVITLVEQLAAAHPPKPGGEHAKNIRKALTYLTNKQPYLDYPTALTSGWPIATGVIEGACRHLVQDRMGITGARWGLAGAEAVLRLRALQANGDLDEYWAYHLQQEHHRNHTSHYATDFTLAA